MNCIQEDWHFCTEQIITKKCAHFVVVVDGKNREKKRRMSIIILIKLSFAIY